MEEMNTTEQPITTAADRIIHHVVTFWGQCMLGYSISYSKGVQKGLWLRCTYNLVLTKYNFTVRLSGRSATVNDSSILLRYICLTSQMLQQV